MEIRRARKSSVSMLPVRFYSERVKRRKRRESRPQRAETESACRDGEEEEGKPRRAGRKGGERGRDSVKEGVFGSRQGREVAGGNPAWTWVEERGRGRRPRDGEEERKERG